MCVSLEACPSGCSYDNKMTMSQAVVCVVPWDGSQPRTVSPSSQSPGTQESKPPHGLQSQVIKGHPLGGSHRHRSPDVKTGAPDIGDTGPLEDVEGVPIGRRQRQSAKTALNDKRGKKVKGRRKKE